MWMKHKGFVRLSPTASTVGQTKRQAYYGLDKPTVSASRSRSIMIAAAASSSHLVPSAEGEQVGADVLLRRQDLGRRQLHTHHYHHSPPAVTPPAVTASAPTGPWAAATAPLKPSAPSSSSATRHRLYFPLHSHYCGMEGCKRSSLPKGLSSRPLRDEHHIQRNSLSLAPT